MTKLTDRRCKDLEAKPPATSARITYDGSLPGFGLRVTPKGAATFVLTYRVNGRQSRIAIGSYGVFTLAGAREEAKRLKQRVARGEDPQAERKAERTAPTVNDLLDRFWRDCAADLAANTVAAYSKYSEDIRRALGREKLADVKLAHVDRFHQSMRHKAPYANRCKDFLGGLFNRAIAWELTDKNPCRGVRNFREEKRVTYLNETEIKAVLLALDQDSNKTAVAVIKLMLLTGARKSEAMNMRFDQVKDGIWIKEASYVKQKREHRVPLSGTALELIAEQYRLHGGRYVFPGATPDEPIKDIKTCWQRTRRRAGLEHVRLHDIRHSFASVLISRGASLPLVGGLLGHSNYQTTLRYSHLHTEAMKEGAEQVAAIIKS